VRDGRPVLAFSLCAFDVYVDPLAVFGDVGEVVDARLSYFEPIARGDLLADESFEFFDTVDDALWHKSSADDLIRAQQR